MDQQPKIPTLKDSQKPQVKVRGLEAGVTLFDRLKQFKKKDLAFILAGLGTLFMAPLAEHFMMSPEGGDATLGAGFGGGSKGGGNGSGIFGNGGSVGGYDSVNGQAPGSAIGGGSDVITPLNVRDPSALVMGPGATQQPPTNSVAPASPPPTAPVTRSDSDLKDALAASARGVSAGAHAAKALLPVPKAALSGNNLRGLGAVSGGSSASGGVGGGISSSGLTSGKANAGGGGLNMVHAAPGYAGVGKRGQSAGGSGLENLKAAGDKAGDVMNRGAAANALDTAASQGIPAGGANFGGAGQGGAGTGDKAGGGNQGKDSKSTGESLEFMKQKAMQEAKIALWAKEQEAGDGKLEMLKIRNTAMETFATEMVKGASAKMSACLFKGFKHKDCMGTAKDNGQYVCTAGPAKDSGPVPISGDDIGDCSDGAAYWLSSGENIIYQCGTSGTGDKAKGINDRSKPQGYNCVSFGADAKSKAPVDPTKDRSVNPNGPNSAGGGLSTPPASMMGGYCSSLTSLQNAFKTGDAKSGISANINDPVLPYVAKEQSCAQGVVSVRNALAQGSPDGDCSAPKLAVDPSVYTAQSQAITFLSGAKGAVPGMLSAVTSYDPEALKDPKAASDSGLDMVVKAGTGLQTVNDYWKSYGKANPPVEVSVVQSDLTRLKANDAKTAFTGIKAAYVKDEESLVTHNKVQKLFDSGADDIVTAVQKAAGAKGDAKGGTVAAVLKNNAAFDALSNKDLAAVNQKEPQAFTIRKPDPAVVKDASAGNAEAVKKATEEATKALETAKKDVAAYAKAIGAVLPGAAPAEGAPNPAPGAVPTDAAAPMSDADKAKLKATTQADLQALTKSYESMWKAQAGDLSSLTQKLTKANTVLTTGK